MSAKHLIAMEQAANEVLSMFDKHENRQPLHGKRTAKIVSYDPICKLAKIEITFTRTALVECPIFRTPRGVAMKIENTTRLFIKAKTKTTKPRKRKTMSATRKKLNKAMRLLKKKGITL